MARDGRFPRRVTGLAAMLLSALALVGCTGSWKWNQKLTVEVTTPDGVKTGSAVSSVSWSKKSSSLTFNYAASYRGEATVVEVAPGKYLFALIGEPTKFLAGTVFGGERPYGNIPAIRETCRATDTRCW